jgi:glycosyltransferase involved in cell wall biosynthesis
VIRVLALIEAKTVTGPAKNLIAFAQQGRNLADPKTSIQLSAVTFERSSASTSGFCAALAELGIPFHLIAERHTGDPRVVSQLRRLINSEQPDIIQTHNSKSHFLARSMGLAQHAPWLAYHHGFTARDRKDKVYNHIARWALKGAPHVVTVCRAFARELEAGGVASSRISVLHNSVTPWPPVPADELAALRETLRIPPNARVVLAVGRLSAEKGHADLISAAAKLNSLNPARDFRMVIVGDGPERAAVQQLAASLGVADLLIMPGEQKNVRPFYGIADVFALPSHSEGSPNVLLEAMVARLPIVATAVGGSVELVSDGETALLVKPRDSQAFAEALNRVLSNPEFAGGLAEKAETASRQYTPQAYTRSMLALYQRILKES